MVGQDKVLYWCSIAITLSEIRAVRLVVILCSSIPSWKGVVRFPQTTFWYGHQNDGLKKNSGWARFRHQSDLFKRDGRKKYSQTKDPFRRNHSTIRCPPMVNTGKIKRQENTLNPKCEGVFKRSDLTKAHGEQRERGSKHSQANQVKDGDRPETVPRSNDRLKGQGFLLLKRIRRKCRQGPKDPERRPRVWVEKVHRL